MDPAKEQGSPGQSGTEGTTDWKAQLEAEREAHAASKKQYAELRSFTDRKVGDLTRELGSRKVETTQPDWTNSYAEPQTTERPRKPNGQYVQTRDEASAYSQALDGVTIDLIRRGTNGWQDELAAAETYIQDPVKAANVATFDANGLVDYRRSIHNAIREIRLERYQSGQSAAQVQTNHQARADAVISGTSASGGDAPVNIDEMSAADMVKSGMLNQFMNPNDPIR